MNGNCCAARRETIGTPKATTVPVTPPAGDRPLSIPVVAIPAGSFAMGNPRADGYPDDGEGPDHTVSLPSFQMSAAAISNDQFRRFVEATGYVTEAERFGWSFVFAGLLPSGFVPTAAAASAPWWRQVFGADWRHPEGPHSSITSRGDHPVVHVSWTDAANFCAWTGTRLPSEAEWEYAARAGSTGTPFWWGNDLTPGGKHRMNVWQGTFPTRNSRADGHTGTAPAISYEANPWGLYNMTGNVWEWCADWFDSGWYARSPEESPLGPSDGTARVMRGGSYLCHRSYCNRYRVDSRSANTPDSSTGNIGFRVVIPSGE
jgi:sulfatase modifying factor 1